MTAQLQARGFARYQRFDSEAESGTMIRQISILTLVAVLLGGVQPGHAQPRPSTSASQAVLDEASRLNKLVEKLYSEGKFGEAVPVAKRALALREKVLGPMQPNVAESLNNFAELYRVQGAYQKAEPLYVRALDTRALARGTGRAEALRQAKLRLLRQPQLAHPYYWAAFIPAGDWTPLDPHILRPREYGR